MQNIQYTQKPFSGGSAVSHGGWLGTTIALITSTNLTYVELV